MKLSKKEYEELFDLVQEFTQRGSIPVRSAQKKDLIFTYEQIVGEYNELQEAKEKGDKVEELDAYLDIMYFAFSCSVIFELETRDHLRRVLDIMVKPIEYFIDCLEKNFIHPNVYSFSSELANIITCCVSSINEMGIDHMKAFREVHAANMRKYVTNELDAKIGAEKYKSKYPKANSTSTPDGWHYAYVMTENTKRILKPDGWMEPNLKALFK